MDKEEVRNTAIALIVIIYLAAAYWFYQDTKSKAKAFEYLGIKIDLMDEVSFIISSSCWPMVVLIGAAFDWFSRKVAKK